MTDTPSDRRFSAQSLGRRLVAGTVKEVHSCGVFVDLGLDHIGHIDPIHIDDTDVYDIGDRVEVYLVGFRAHNGQYELRPKGKMPLSELLRQKER